jgi:hypothetical protein
MSRVWAVATDTGTTCVPVPREAAAFESAEAQPSQDAETNRVSESAREGRRPIARNPPLVVRGRNRNKREIEEEEPAGCGEAAGCAAGLLSAGKFPAKERENETGIVGIMLNILTLESELRLRNIVS